MKPESKSPTPNSRRHFLLGATLGSAGAVAAVVAGSSVGEVTVALTVENKPEKAKGYRLTPHIAQYYETTKL